jgi:hypothetical protein
VGRTYHILSTAWAPDVTRFELLQQQLHALIVRGKKRRCAEAGCEAPPEAGALYCAAHLAETRRRTLDRLASMAAQDEAGVREFAPRAHDTTVIRRPD